MGGPSTSRAAIDYREYREKKEREKATAAAIVPQSGHLIDPNKHHSHHHKPVTNPNMPNKHQIPSVQKGTFHHNHHHRPDLKIAVQPQRHSSSSQPREPSRDPSRRVSREPNVGVAHSSHANLDTSSSESAPHRTDSVTQDSSSSMHSNLQEKLTNSNHSGHRLNVLDSKHQLHDKRMYRGEDPRLKSAKYADMNRIETQRRKETLEQRCEEVRKLIEKPLPPPKQVDIPYLMNPQQKQQSHHTKYNQQEKSQGSLPGDVKHAIQNTLPQDKSPTAPVSTLSSQGLQKTVPAKTQTHNQYITQDVSQILKDTIKNGSSQSCLSNMDDLKTEKRSRTAVHEETVEKNSADIQQQNLHLHTPPRTTHTNRHKSLFSPETPSKESHAIQRPKSRQKTPPFAMKIKESRMLAFASPSTSQESSMKRSRQPGDNLMSLHKKPRTSSSESEQPKPKTEIEDVSSFETMKILGCIPELLQPIRDNTSVSSNGKNASLIKDLKVPELIKPFEPDTPRFNAMTQHKAPSMNVHTLTNGIELNVIKQDTLEHRIKNDHSLEHYSKKESSGQKVPETLHSHVQSKLEYTSPMKSAQSINALLQETLTPMPSLLQGLQHTQAPPPQIHQELQQQPQQPQQPSNSNSNSNSNSSSNSNSNDLFLIRWIIS